MKVAIITLSFFFICSTSEAIQCLTCQNARSNEECQRIGRVIECPENEDACQNEIRKDSRGVVISKRCKQSTACNNNYIQNPKAAWLPVQCNMKHENTVCRCCCFKDNCNHDTYECPNDCPPHPVPSNGARECRFVDRYTEEKSECTYICNEGFKVFGHANAACIRVGDQSRFTHPAPICIQSSCSPAYSSLFNGKVSCSNGNLHGSVCDFKCNYGFHLVGSSSTICRENNRWITSRPICRSIRCRPAVTGIEHGLVRCSNYNVVGSLCKYICKRGYKIEGRTWVRCKDDGDSDTTGKWSSLPPSCVAHLSTSKVERSSCKSLHINPINGFVSCTDGNFRGSVCTFSCQPGYGIVGEEQSSCVGDELKATWSSSAPTCEPITCSPKMENFEKGTAVCTAGNNIFTECTFTCELGMQLVGESVIMCMDDEDGDLVGRWSDPMPTCKPVRCSPPLKAPVNGNMTGCSDTEPSELYSRCLFQCHEGYQLGGSEANFIMCECGGDEDDYGDCTGQGGAQWSDVEPLCEPNVCEELGPLENGFISCSGENNLNTVCTHTCDVGYRLNGQSEIRCIVDELFRGELTWSDYQPICEEVGCDPRHIAPDFGTVDCTNDNLHGSVCTFACPTSDRFLTGLETSTCTGGQDGNLSWDSTETPVCELLDCIETPEIPENGSRVCSDGQRLGSVCEFACSVYYEMEGAANSTCLQNSDGSFSFDSPPPECIPITCDEQGPLENGVYECSKENDVDSKCDFSCDEDQGWVVYPKSSTSNTCVLDATGMGYSWNIPMPCCARACPPHALMDIVIALESSFQSETENWILQKEFVTSLISEFVVSTEFAQVSLFTYNKDVNVDFEIPFNSFTSETINGLDTLFPESSHEEGVVNTGLALQHMHQSSFTQSSGDRPGVPNVGLVITDGSVDDPERLLLNSERLRNDGVTIYAVGVGNAEDLSGVLDAITGDPSKSAIAANHLGLHSILSSLSEMLCPNPCP